MLDTFGGEIYASNPEDCTNSTKKLKRKEIISESNGTPWYRVKRVWKIHNCRWILILNRFSITYKQQKLENEAGRNWENPNFLICPRHRMSAGQLLRKNTVYVNRDCCAGVQWKKIHPKICPDSHQRGKEQSFYRDVSEDLKLQKINLSLVFRNVKFGSAPRRITVQYDSKGTFMSAMRPTVSALEIEKIKKKQADFVFRKQWANEITDAIFSHSYTLRIGGCRSILDKFQLVAERPNEWGFYDMILTGIRLCQE